MFFPLSFFLSFFPLHSFPLSFSLLSLKKEDLVERAMRRTNETKRNGTLGANGVFSSASPLNGEAALLWDSDKAEFKRKLDARHLEPAEMEEAA